MNYDSENNICGKTLETNEQQSSCIFIFTPPLKADLSTNVLLKWNTMSNAFSQHPLNEKYRDKIGTFLKARWSKESFQEQNLTVAL